MPTELPPKLHPVHQRDTYPFHGNAGGATAPGQEAQNNFGNPQGLTLPAYSSANHRSGQLPDPPIPVSEIGPIPPPPMFSSPSPLVTPRSVPPPPYHPPTSTSSVQSAHGFTLSNTSYEGEDEAFFWVFFGGCFSVQRCLEGNFGVGQFRFSKKLISKHANTF